MKRDLLSLQSLTTDEIMRILKSAGALKKSRGKRRGDLKNKSIGLLFQKPSNRTRVSFEVGICVGEPAAISAASIMASDKVGWG